MELNANTTATATRERGFLFEFTGGLLSLLKNIEATYDPDTGEITDEEAFDKANAAFAAAKASWTQKALAVAAFIAEKKAEAQALKDREKQLYLRRRAKEGVAGRLSSYLVANMIQADTRKIEDDQICASLAKKPASLEIVDEHLIPQGFWKPQDPVLDKAGLKSAIKAGLDCPGARLVEGGWGVRIK